MSTMAERMRNSFNTQKPNEPEFIITFVRNVNVALDVIMKGLPSTLDMGKGRGTPLIVKYMEKMKVSEICRQCSALVKTTDANEAASLQCKLVGEVNEMAALWRMFTSIPVSDRVGMSSTDSRAMASLSKMFAEVVDKAIMLRKPNLTPELRPTDVTLH